MHVIYHDIGGSHSSVVASYIHLNKLPIDRIPSAKEIIEVPMFDKLRKNQRGRLIFHGIDEYKNKVYTLSRLYYEHPITNALMSIPSMIGIDEREIMLVDTSPSVNFIMKLGGGSSRKLKMVTFGRPIVAYGITKTYGNIVDLVTKTKLKISSNFLS
ncbi:DUF3189 family protein [Maledivibacter halophilus]|uniref:DUF3189 domain-containing protein n=1 Tax=Maledivibacter halophilus TaxID=36842 RepID=A0A1T5M5G0_9FIRM|nr:DUF3189 family protein [Maledivibacter halophilus]SKC83471.1 Protein of unknown function [Maledivibacter halophilus]